MQKWYDIVHNKGANEAEILIYGVIGDSWFEESVTASQFRKDFKALEAEVDIINIRINTPGGSVWDGLAIYNTIEQSKKQTVTYNDGIAYSMGAILLQAGKKRRAAKNSSTMTHDALTLAYGNAEEMRRTADMLDKITHGSIAENIAAKTGLSKEEVKTKFFNYKDNFFTAQEALDEKLIDEIVEYDIENTFDTKNLSYKEIVNKYIKFDTVPKKPIGQGPTSILEDSPSKNSNDMKYVALTALINAFKEGKTPTNEQITAAQTELTDANSGLVIITATENKSLNDIKKIYDTVNPVHTEITALFPNAKEEKFNLVEEIKALKTKAEAYDKLDGDDITRTDGPVDLTDAQKLKAKIDAMPHNQKADEIFG